MDAVLPRVLPLRIRNTSLNTEKIVTKSALLISILVFSLSLFLANGIYYFCCLVTLILMVYQSWRFGKPGIIVFAFIYQWVQIVAYVIWMNVNDFNIDHLSRNAGIAIIESCGGLL